MNYEEALRFIHSRDKFGSNLGLLRIEKLLSSLGNPHKKLKYVHVAGTNGKGSTSTMISEILICSGCKTGLFTSPYVIDFCERIQINGKMIPHEALSEIIGEIAPKVEALDNEGFCATEFETVTAAAFIYFLRENCDVVVLEVGLGGRLDSTNVIDTPLASVITSISLDHMNVLGNTVSEIAYEKAGIIKENGKTVVYPDMNEEALEVILRTAALKNNVVYSGNAGCAEIIREDITGTEFKYGDLNVFVPLSGNYQVKNAITAIECARALKSQGINITDENIVNGIKRTRIPARMEIISASPLVLLDGGHNEDASRVLYDNIKNNVGGGITAVIGFMADKDYETYFKRLCPLFDRIIVTEASNPRKAGVRELYDYAVQYCGNVSKCADPFEAVLLAKRGLKSGDALLVCGSLYLAGDVRDFLINTFKDMQ